MSNGIEVRREGEIEFSKPLARALFRDLRLSFAARGLFAFLWDLPADWIIRSTWLATRGPEGKDAIRARLAELRAVGAMRFEPIRGPNGRVSGTRWVLVSPDKWAKAASLSDSTESRVSRPSVFPTIGKPATKVHQELTVHQSEGSPPPPNGGGYGGGGDLPSDWTEAATLEIEIEGKQRAIRNPAGLRRKIIDRYRANDGPDTEVLAELDRRRKAAAQRAANEAAQQASLASPSTSTDLATNQAAKQRGEWFLAQASRKRSMAS